jgi:hypothetical protein
MKSLHIFLIIHLILWNRHFVFISFHSSPTPLVARAADGGGRGGAGVGDGFGGAGGGRRLRRRSGQATASAVRGPGDDHDPYISAGCCGSARGSRRSRPRLICNGHQGHAQDLRICDGGGHDGLCSPRPNCISRRRRWRGRGSRPRAASCGAAPPRRAPWRRRCCCSRAAAAAASGLSPSSPSGRLPQTSDMKVSDDLERLEKIRLVHRYIFCCLLLCILTQNHRHVV